MKLTGFVLAALLLVGGLAAQTPTASVQGIVVGTGERGGPVSGATVEVRRLDGTAPQAYTATTAGDGSFVVPSIRPGDYVLGVRRMGFFPAEYGQKRMNQPGTRFTLTAGQNMASVTVTMTPSGVIYGRITDTFGDPVGAAEVRALVFAYQKGVRTLKVAQSTVTNDLGQYRLFDLVPGQYVISATPTTGLPIYTVVINGNGSTPLSPALLNPFPLGRSESPDETYLPQYFPGVLDPRFASTIELKAGDAYGAADFAVAPSRTRHVRGSMRGSGQAVSIQLVPVVPVPGTMTLEGSVDPITGLFDIPGVAPGAYLLVAISEDSMSRQLIEVGDGDVNNIGLALTGGFSVPGRLTIDDRQPSDNDPDMDRIYFDIVSDPAIQGAPVDTYSPVLNGTFRLRELIPGDYHVANFSVRGSGPTLQTAYLKSIRLGDQDVLNSGLHVAGPIEGTLEIVVGTRPATLSGRVLNARGQPVGNATVVLAIDTTRRSRSDSFRVATSDASGRFQINSVRPGSFKIFAWENVEDTAWQDPDFLRAYEDRGKVIQVNENARETAEVTAIP